jgi:hypothetical protein
MEKAKLEKAKLEKAKLEKAKPIDSETYRQMLVRDGERRRREWQLRSQQHQAQYRQGLAKNRTQYIPSEQYRHSLVKDGERRFQEWHQSFLAYQQNFHNRQTPR